MPKTSFPRVAAAASLVVIAAAFAPSSRHDDPPPDLCGLAARLNDAALTGVCGRIQYVGYGTFTELNLLPAGVDVLAAINDTAQGRDEVVARRHFFSYDEFVVTVRDDGEPRLDMVLRTAAALARIKGQHPDLYRFMTAMKVFATAPSRPVSAWKNRYERIFISFDRTPDDIAAAVSLLGSSVDANGVSYYTNYALISTDEETILGATAGKGSEGIYHRPAAAENYRTYMADGLIYTLAHESTHAYIGYTNSTSRLANAIYSARGGAGVTDAEEIVANQTAMSFVDGIVSPEMRQHVMEQNAIMVGNPEVRARLDEWGAFVSRSGSRLVVPD
jgi:hypothetical protein